MAADTTTLDILQPNTITSGIITLGRAGLSVSLAPIRGPVSRV